MRVSDYEDSDDMGELEPAAEVDAIGSRVPMRAVDAVLQVPLVPRVRRDKETGKWPLSDYSIPPKVLYALDRNLDISKVNECCRLKNLQ